MNNSRNIRFVMVFTKLLNQITRQCRFLNTKTGPLTRGLATRPVLCKGLLVPKSRSLSSTIGSYMHYHLLNLDSCPSAGEFRQNIGHCQHLQPFAKSFRLGIGVGRSFSVNLPKDDKTRTDEPAEPMSDNTTDANAQLDIDGIADGDPILERKLKILILELDVWRQEGKRMPTPSLIKKESWKELLHAQTRSARMKVLTYLWQVEMKKLKKQVKKQQHQQGDNEEVHVNLRELEDNDGGPLQYGLHNNSMFMRIYDTAINQHYNNKLIQAIQFGQKLVIDCGYDQFMTPHEAKNLAKQITISYSDNRQHEDPFNIYLCNANRKGKTLTQLQHVIKTLYEDYFPINVTSKSYLELFPKESIVYLSPHCREELTSYDPYCVYVIGGIVDKSNTDQLSLAKAKKEGLKMAKLPLDRYLAWGSGSGKSLTINQMVQIMLEIKTSGDWTKALEYVPRRKLFTPDSDFKPYKRN